MLENHRGESPRRSEGTVKTSHILFVISAIYIAPHVSPAVGIGCAIFYCGSAFYHLWKEA